VEPRSTRVKKRETNTLEKNNQHFAGTKGERACRRESSKNPPRHAGGTACGKKTRGLCGTREKTICGDWGGRVPRKQGGLRDNEAAKPKKPGPRHLSGPSDPLSGGYRRLRKMAGVERLVDLKNARCLLSRRDHFARGKERLVPVSG